MASGCVESMLKLMGDDRGKMLARQRRCVVSNLVGREDNDSRMESDETIVEEVLDALKMTLEDRRVYGRRYATCSLDAVGCQPRKQRREQEEARQSRGHSGACANTDATRRRIGRGRCFGAPPAFGTSRSTRKFERRSSLSRGALDALAEARRVGSDDTKRKVKGALWMIEGQSEEAMEKTASADAIEKLGNEGTVENAKGQVMLSYEWRTQQQVLRLRDILMEQGFTVWMDVDRMMGSPRGDGHRHRTVRRHHHVRHPQI